MNFNKLIKFNDNHFVKVKPRTSSVKKVANVLWFVFGGLWMLITEALAGVALCLTIIGIPFGIQHFKILKLEAAPFGKRVVNNFKSHPFLNVFYFIFGGFEIAVVQYIIAILFCLTIIGIPHGTVIASLARFNFAPFGAEIVLQGEATSKKNTRYDLDLLFNRVRAEPDKLIKNSNGKEYSGSTYINQGIYINDKIRSLYDKITKLHKFNNFSWLLIAPPTLNLILSLCLGSQNSKIIEIIIIILGVLFILGICFFISLIVANEIISKLINVEILKQLRFMFDYYDNDSYFYKFVFFKKK